MSDTAFLSQLGAFPSKPVRFTVNGQQLVPNDFHVTEIKKVSIESLDCGGGASAWQELVIQLWSPVGDNTPEAMTAEKFTEIMAKADALSLLDREHIRFEYAAVGEPAIQYTLSELHAEDEALEINLIAPYVACKPLERSQMSELSVVGASICCAPSSSTNPETSASPERGAGCCA